MAGRTYIFIIQLIFILIIFSFYSFTKTGFKNQNVKPEKTVSEQVDLAIEKAQAEGVYNCCIEPACTMCFLQANQWNNQTQGTCACDDLINQGKQPCPECLKGGCNNNEAGACNIN
jgi:hypothetical protein